jgi:hypothetical protein
LADGEPSGFDAALDDLESRLSAAERGDLAALSGWSPPTPLEAPSDTGRAERILARQRDLLARLREEQAGTAAALSSLRKPRSSAFSTPASPPVYVDLPL